MREKGFRFLVGLVIITAATGCDNVAFGGIQVELRAPPPPPGSAPVEGALDLTAPLDLGSILYLVERFEDSQASIVPVAVLADRGYRALPDSSQLPGLLDRFPLGRWEPGTEFTLFAQGVRAGTFITDGTSEVDASTCQARPRAVGRIELRPEAVSQQRFLALTPVDVPSSSGPLTPGLIEDAPLRAAATGLAQRLIPEMGVQWPPSIPAIRRDLQPIVLESGGAAGLAVSFVYGDGLVVGPPTRRLAYSLFILAEATPARYEPVFAWYQRYDSRGKAFPRFLAAHDAHGIGAPDALLEVFGESARWLAIVGPQEGQWRVLFQDGCGVPASADGLRTFP
ncbi:MAG: hypothetical protein EXR92_03010 [Gemmatimonadetes bacterium]|nr:hypothetical protein [Gemmatimonadota bacterium]